MEVPGPPNELVAALVIIATSELGTPVAEEGGLLSYCQYTGTDGHQDLDFLLLCSYELLILKEEVVCVLKMKNLRERPC